MNRVLSAVAAFVAAMTLVSTTVADDAPRPSDAERQAVAALHAAGGVLSIDGEFRVVTVSFARRGGSPSDEDLAHLTALPHLESLAISGATITDNALGTLTQLKSLRQLRLSIATVTAEQEEQLRAALPDCNVTVRGGGRARRTPDERDRVPRAPGERDDRGGAFRGSWGFRFAGSSLVLRLPNVQADLNLTPEQRNRVTELFSAAFREQREEADVRELLSEEQYARLKQVKLQIEGVGAIARPEIAAELNLTDAQIETVQGLIARNGEAVRALAGAPRGDRGFSRESQEARTKLDAQLAEDILAALTDEQRVRWQELIGPPIAPVRAESPSPDANPAGEGE